MSSDSMRALIPLAAEVSNGSIAAGKCNPVAVRNVLVIKWIDTRFSVNTLQLRADLECTTICWRSGTCVSRWNVEKAFGHLPAFIDVVHPLNALPPHQAGIVA